MTYVCFRINKFVPSANRRAVQYFNDVCMFSDKQKIRQRNIILIEDETVISENSAVAEKLNNYFIDVIENLEIEHCNENYGQ